ncbi:hypothetical protein CMV_008311 [Castanea mollissima]|uniref:Uncharacterized protein n=1 Tax=Castanea mollissima TaxID=60419 RepID=A0A8J4VS66_9ROSI|nr:hypothetical protein CMV_008311 [Castanea mollissima]
MSSTGQSFSPEEQRTISKHVNGMLEIHKDMSKSIARMEAMIQDSWDQMIKRIKTKERKQKSKRSQVLLKENLERRCATADAYHYYTAAATANLPPLLSKPCLKERDLKGDCFDKLVLFLLCWFRISVPNMRRNAMTEENAGGLLIYFQKQQAKNPSFLYSMQRILKMQISRVVMRKVQRKKKVEVTSCLPQILFLAARVQVPSHQIWFIPCHISIRYMTIGKHPSLIHKWNLEGDSSD